jgi:hypothetical protein
VPTGDFTTSGNGTCGALPISVAPGSSCTFLPAFAPTAVGTRNGTVTLTSNDPASPTTTALVGTGTPPPAPDFQPPASPIAFGSTNVGTSSAPQSYKVDNTLGTATLTVNTRTVSGNFSVSSNGSCGVVPFNVLAGTSCNFSLVFSPLSAGPLTGSAVLTQPTIRIMRT